MSKWVGWRVYDPWIALTITLALILESPSPIPPATGATAVFIFFQFAKYNVLSLLAYALCAAVIAMPIWRLLGPRFGRCVAQLLFSQLLLLACCTLTLPSLRFYLPLISLRFALQSPSPDAAHAVRGCRRGGGARVC